MKHRVKQGFIIFEKSITFCGIMWLLQIAKLKFLHYISKELYFSIVQLCYRWNLSDFLNSLSLNLKLRQKIKFSIFNYFLIKKMLQMITKICGMWAFWPRTKVMYFDYSGETEGWEVYDAQGLCDFEKNIERKKHKQIWNQ